MPTPRIDNLEVTWKRRDLRSSRLWREWCFLRLLFRRFWKRFVFVALVMCGGALSFIFFHDPGEEDPTFIRALFKTWQLVLGEMPGEFPESRLLEILFFIMPIIGLLVIIESIIEFSLMLRDRSRYERSWCTMLAKTYSDHIILVGFGRLGYRTFLLLRKLGQPVVVIERDEKNEFLEELRRDGSPLLLGDARREALLEDANVAKARSIVLATDDDMANLEIALDARKISPEIRVVVRMFDQNVADKMGDGFNIHIAMSQSAISAPTFAVSAIESSIVNSVIVDDRLIVMQRWLVRDSGPLAGRAIRDLIEDEHISVVEHVPVRGDRTLFPSVDTVLERGDQVVVQGTLEVLTALQERAIG